MLPKQLKKYQNYPIIEFLEKILRGYYKKQRDYNDHTMNLLD